MLRICAPCHAIRYGVLRGDRTLGPGVCSICGTPSETWDCQCQVKAASRPAGADYLKAERAIQDLRETLRTMKVHHSTGGGSLHGVYGQMLDAIDIAVKQHKQNEIRRLELEPARMIVVPAKED